MFQVTRSKWKGKIVVNILITIAEGAQNFDNVWMASFLNYSEGVVLSQKVF